jgi:long-chain fatty acid transport protein
MTLGWRTLLLGVLTLLAAQAEPHEVQALDRGSRPLSRGGAFVAGADDPNALWYNPAGLDESGNQLFSDWTINFFWASFRRYNEDGSYAPTVEGDAPRFPLGSLALSHTFGLEDFTFAAGLFSPNGLGANWPRSLPGPNGTREPAPTRYSLISSKGSALAYAIAGFAYDGIEGLSLGVDVHVPLGRFHVEAAQSGYDGVVCPYPEQWDCDTYSAFDTSFAYAVTAGFGFKYRLGEQLRIGASVVLPYALELRGRVQIQRWPDNPAFRDAYLSDDRVDLKIRFPTIVRGGIEYRPQPFIRLEAAFSWEQMSRQTNLTVAPHDRIFIRGGVGLDSYEMGPLSVDSHMRDTWSIRLGYEVDIPDLYALDFMRKLKQTTRAGISYERGAFANGALTPATLDTDKVMIAMGNSFTLTKRLRVESTIGYIFMPDPRVRNSQVLLPSGLRPPPSGRTAIGNGDYALSALFIGGGLTVQLD